MMNAPQSRARGDLRLTLLGAAALAAVSIAGNPLSASTSVAAAPVPAGTGTEWHNVNGDTNETGFSKLSQITAANAGRLGLAWSLDLPGEASLEAPPVIANGIIYFTGAYATVYAVDGATGTLLWSYDPKTWEHNPEKMHYSFAANRGVAYDNGKIFVASNDARLIALDAKTGRVLWQTETTDPKNGQTTTGAPRAFAGKVIIGNGGADFGMRGYVTAYDQQTGKQVWRFYVVPGSPDQNKGDPAMEAAAKTWGGEFWKKGGGGGGPWDSMTYDAEMNRIYVGTANAYSYNPDERSPGNGDNLYTASVVALDASTGKYLWHYQVNPRDSWDFDCTQQMILATLTIDGRPRKVLMQAPKNGFFYVIDRETGKLISAEKLGYVTWASRIDRATGRPVEADNVRYANGQFAMFPSSTGLHSWMRMAFSPQTGLVYVPTMNLGTRFRRGTANEQEMAIGGVSMQTDTSAPGPKAAIVAWDPVAQKERWRVAIDTPWNGGVLATAGEVVFMGAGDGWFTAYNALTGARLWRSQVGMGIIAAPSSYAIAGKQYVSVLAGYGGTASMLSPVMNVGWKYSGPRRLLTFALGGSRKLPATPGPTMAVNLQDDPTERLDPAPVATGKAMFMACAACHGINAVSAGGPAPDLRESPMPLSKDAFFQVVHEGVLLPRGMPRFQMFTPAQVEALRQYIRSEARNGLARK